MVISTLSGVTSNEKYSDLNYKTLDTKSHDPLSKPPSAVFTKGVAEAPQAPSGLRPCGKRRRAAPELNGFPAKGFRVRI